LHAGSFPDKWLQDDNDPQGEINVSLKLPNEVQIWPVQKVMKRYQNGSEDAIYSYVYTVTKEFTNLFCNKECRVLTAENNEPESTKPW
jgi:hypothetical protein